MKLSVFRKLIIPVVSAVVAYLVYRHMQSGKKTAAPVAPPLRPQPAPAASQPKPAVSEAAPVKAEPKKAAPKKAAPKKAAPQKAVTKKASAPKKPGRKKAAALEEESPFRHPKKVSKKWDEKALKKVERWLKIELDGLPKGESIEVAGLVRSSGKVAQITERGNADALRYLLWQQHVKGRLNFADNLHFSLI